MYIIEILPHSFQNYIGLYFPRGSIIHADIKYALELIMGKSNIFFVVGRTITNFIAAFGRKH